MFKIVPGTNRVPYPQGRDFDLQNFICRVLGQPRALTIQVRALHLDGERHYHTFDHALDVAVEIMLAGYDEFIEFPHELLLAALYHDAVYVAGAKDNEEKSAEVVRKAIAEFDMKDIEQDYVCQLIMATSKHFTDFKPHNEMALFLDADIHGFAAPWNIFVKHQEDIQRESLSISSHQEVMENHLKFFRGLLERPTIFYSKRGQRTLESTARANIKRYLDQ